MSAEDQAAFAVQFDRDDLTRADFATRATVVNSLIAAEVINRNEARAWFGYGKRPGGEAFGNPNINPGGEADTKPDKAPDEEGQADAAE